MARLESVNVFCQPIVFCLQEGQSMPIDSLRFRGRRYEGWGPRVDNGADKSRQVTVCRSIGSGISTGPAGGELTRITCAYETSRPRGVNVLTNAVAVLSGLLRSGTPTIRTIGCVVTGIPLQGGDLDEDGDPPRTHTNSLHPSRA